MFSGLLFAPVFEAFADAESEALGALTVAHHRMTDSWMRPHPRIRHIPAGFADSVRVAKWSGVILVEVFI
jgi:hypothetical protein